MPDTNARRQLRQIGAIWIVLAPLGWLMAAISSVKDEAYYQLQLAVFTVVASAALVFGVAAMFRRMWARVGLIAVSWFAALMFIGPGLYLFGTALLSQPWEIALMGVSIASLGVPFAVMAFRLHRLGTGAA